MAAIKLILPWPPTLNHYRQPVCRGKRARLITSTDGRDYKVRAFTAIIEQGRPQITGPVRVSERFFPKTNAAYDMDNFRKATRDALVEAGVIEDDSLIVEDHGVKCPKDRGNPRVEIVIERAKENA